MAFAEEPDTLRKGKWVLEEEAYATRLIQLFNQGLLVLPEGTTLRSYLAEKLNCDPMRITKKFTGASCLGKRVFHSRKHTDATLVETQHAQAELNCLEARFHSRLEQDRERSKEACMIDLEARFLNASNVVSSPAIDAFIMQSCANQTWSSKPEPDDTGADAAASQADAFEGPPAAPAASNHEHEASQMMNPHIPSQSASYWASGYEQQPAEATCMDASWSSVVQPTSGMRAPAAEPHANTVLLPSGLRDCRAENCDDSNTHDGAHKPGGLGTRAAVSFHDERRDGLCLPLDGGHSKRARCEPPPGFAPGPEDARVDS